MRETETCWMLANVDRVKDQDIRKFMEHTELLFAVWAFKRNQSLTSRVLAIALYAVLD